MLRVSARLSYKKNSKHVASVDEANEKTDHGKDDSNAIMSATRRLTYK